MIGKCPKCEKPVSRVNIGDVTVNAGPAAPQWKGISYVCSICGTVLGVSIDPIAIKTDIIRGVLRELGK